MLTVSIIVRITWLFWRSLCGRAFPADNLARLWQIGCGATLLVHNRPVNQKLSRHWFNTVRLAQELRRCFLFMRLKNFRPENTILVLRAVHGGMFSVLGVYNPIPNQDVRATLGAAVVAIVLWFACDCLKCRPLMAVTSRMSACTGSWVIR
jgi:hypothetical protein